MIDLLATLNDPYLRALSAEHRIALADRLRAWGLLTETFLKTVDRWFSNFDAQDKHLAHALLLNIDYYSSARLADRLDALHLQLQRLIQRLHLDEVNLLVVTAEGGGDSSHRHAYDITKAWHLARSQVVAVGDLARVVHETSVLVLFNDTYGSGGQFRREVWPHIASLAPPPAAVIVVGLAIAREALEFFGSLPSVTILPDSPCPNAREVFSAAEYDRLAALGAQVYSKHPVGYGDTALLTAYYFQCPNNTLPLVWADSESGNNAVGGVAFPWFPLFPYHPKVQEPSPPRAERDSPPAVEISAPQTTAAAGPAPFTHPSELASPPTPAVSEDLVVADGQPLYGRHHIVERVVASLTSSQTRRVLLHGPGGIGKTSIVNAVNLRLRAPPSCSFPILPRPQDTTDSLQHWLTEVVAQLLKSIPLPLVQSPGLLGLAARHAPTHSLQAAVTTLLRLSIRDQPEKVSALVAAFTPASKSASTPGALPHLDEDAFFAGFLGLARTLDAAGISACLIVDQAESCSSRLLRVLVTLSHSLPAGWGLLIAVNDETPHGSVVLRELLEQTQYKGTIAIAVPGLALADFESWVATGVAQDFDISKVRLVLDACGGRPLLLREWIRSPQLDPTLLAADRLGLLYEGRVAHLTPPARRLLHHLCILPPNTTLTFGLCNAISRASDPIDTLVLVEELRRADLLQPDPSAEDAYRIHEIVQQHILSKTPRELLRAAAPVLRTALQGLGLASSPHFHYAIATLAAYNGEWDEVLREAPDAAKLLASNGSFPLGLRLFEISLQAASALGDRARVAALELGLAAAHLDAGYYQEGIARLARIGPDDLAPAQRAEQLLLEGKCLLRLNRYGEALSALRKAEEAHKAVNDANGEIESRKEAITILRDLGRHGEAVEQARTLVQQAALEGIRPLVKASCLRALSRSLALIHDFVGANETATAALGIAVDERAMRAEGNAYLALGEAHRHGGFAERAVEHYERAAAIGDDVGNRDSLLWSLLGLADAFLCQRRFDESALALSRLGEYVARQSARYPLEHLHWRLAVAFLRLARGLPDDPPLADIARDYVGLGIDWPTSYVSAVLANRDTALFSPKPY